VIFYQLSLEFGWTPTQIRRLTLQELEHYFAQSWQHRKDVQPPDVSLEAIRRALYQFFGAKEPDSAQTMQQKIAKMGGPTLTEAEMRAWTDAGMPSPFDAWLRNYRRERHD
jgi:hypothetical protein